MGTMNGIGTQYYGWEYNEDETAYATNWFVFGFLPVVPLSRHQLQLSNTEPVEGAPWYASYEYLETCPLDMKNVRTTYFWAYAVLLPILIMPPLISKWAFSAIFPNYSGPRGETTVQKVILITLIFGNLAYVGVIAAYILDRAMGRKKW